MRHVIHTWAHFPPTCTMATKPRSLKAMSLVPEAALRQVLGSVRQQLI